MIIEEKFAFDIILCIENVTNFTDTCKSNSTGVNITKYPFSEVFADFSKINILKFYLKSTNMVSNVFAKTLLKPNQRKFYTSKISSYTLIKHSLSSHMYIF